MIARRLCGAGLLAALVTTVAAEPALTLVAGGRTAIYTAGGLLGLPVATTVTIPVDVAYKRSMSFRAVPMAALLDGVAPDEGIRFTAADGFVTTIPAAALLAREGPVAYLAVEPPDAPWPALKAGEAASAGPFYLVWTLLEKAAPANEQWPYRIVRIDTVASLVKRFPMIAPAARLAANDPIRVGFAAFQKHCMVCHTLNGGGDAMLGPDLNIPYNPTEYLRPDALRRLIRDPQALRRWPGAKMPAFDSKTLPDRELAELLAYLRHMADRKVVPPVAK
ncbi:MAG TPA: cytochrome c [Casimicrobiaceae bacterium]|jgi:mono/diheme cytochrome c family protein|nr:cytochrome c [Casimicrobiaceae bacterium]